MKLLPGWKLLDFLHLSQGMNNLGLDCMSLCALPKNLPNLINNLFIYSNPVNSVKNHANWN